MTGPLPPLSGARLTPWVRLTDRRTWRCSAGMATSTLLIGLNYPFSRAIETQDLNDLTNSWPFLAYSLGCNIGQFDNDWYWPDAIGEDLVTLHSRGAFAAILNSREGLYDPQDEAKYSGEFQEWFFDHLLNQGQTNLGVAYQLSKHDLLGNVESSGVMSYRFCYYEITLFGDPHLAWQTPPPTPQLTIASAHGGASPAAGAHSLPYSTFLTCQVTNSPVADGPGQRYVCTGWKGTGSVPASGSSSQVTLTITNDSQLTWQWATQFHLAATAGANGTVSASNGWLSTDVSTGISAVPTLYHYFVRWSGDVEAGQESNAVILLTMNQPRTLVATFAENLTAQGTPEWWLAGYGWTNQFETAAEADADHDGMPAWQEYVAGTSPVDSSSCLRLGARQLGASTLQLSWPSASNRMYSVFLATDLAPGGFVSLTNLLPATPPMNVFTHSALSNGNRFYHVEVQLAP